MEFQQFQKSVSSHLFALLSLEVASSLGRLFPRSYMVYILAAQQPFLKSVFLSGLFQERFLWVQLRSYVITESITVVRLCALIGQA